jgi:hypothetical protein
MAAPIHATERADPYTVGIAHFRAGQTAARYAAGLGGIERLFDEHVAGWPAAEPLKRYALSGLRERANWNVATDRLLQAVSLVPHEVGWQRYLAIVLERAGLFDRALLIRQVVEHVSPGTVDNQAAIARLRDYQGGDGRHAEWPGLLGRAATPRVAEFCRRVALAPTPLLDAHRLDALRGIVHKRLLIESKDPSLHLAQAFLAMARRDFPKARESFLEASLLARQPRPGGIEEWDPWSIAFAESFLVDGAHTNDVGLVPTDPLNLQLLHAAALQHKGAILSALALYANVTAQLIPGSTPKTYRIYKSHTIVLHQGRFYAVPREVRHFAIINGVVVRGARDPYGNSAQGGWLSRLLMLLNPLTRERVKTTMRRRHAAGGGFFRGLHAIIPIGGPITRLLTALVRRIGRVVRPLYVRHYAVRGVLTDVDLVPLQQRIDRLANG